MIALQIPYSLALMAMTTLRSIGVITSEIQNIRKARDFRGRALWKRNPIKWAEQELMMFKPIVIRAYISALCISQKHWYCVGFLQMQRERSIDRYPWKQVIGCCYV